MYMHRNDNCKPNGGQTFARRVAVRASRRTRFRSAAPYNVYMSYTVQVYMYSAGYSFE